MKCMEYLRQLITIPKIILFKETRPLCYSNPKLETVQNKHEKIFARRDIFERRVNFARKVTFTQER